MPFSMKKTIQLLDTPGFEVFGSSWVTWDPLDPPVDFFPAGGTTVDHDATSCSHPARLRYVFSVLLAWLSGNTKNYGKIMENHGWISCFDWAMLSPEAAMFVLWSGKPGRRRPGAAGAWAAPTGPRRRVNGSGAGNALRRWREGG